MSEQANIGGIRQVLVSIESWAEAIYSLLDARLPTKGEPCPCGCRRDAEPKPLVSRDTLAARLAAVETCDCEPCSDPEPETVTVARVPIPERNRLAGETEAEWARRVADEQDMDYCRTVGRIATEGLLTSQIIRRYADALDAANGSQP